MLVNDLTRGIQDNNLPDMVPKPGNPALYQYLNFLTWYRNPCETRFLLLSNLPDFYDVGRTKHSTDHCSPSVHPLRGNSFGDWLTRQSQLCRVHPQTPPHSTRNPGHSSETWTTQQVDGTPPCASGRGEQRHCSLLLLTSPTSLTRPTTPSLPGSRNNRSQQPPTSRPTCRRHWRAHVTNPEPKMKPDLNMLNQKKKSPPQPDKSSSQPPMPIRWVQLRLSGPRWVSVHFPTYLSQALTHTYHLHTQLWTVLSLSPLYSQIWTVLSLSRLHTQLFSP